MGTRPGVKGPRSTACSTLASCVKRTVTEFSSLPERRFCRNCIGELVIFLSSAGRPASLAISPSRSQGEPSQMLVAGFGGLPYIGQREHQVGIRHQLARLGDVRNKPSPACDHFHAGPLSMLKSLPQGGPFNWKVGRHEHYHERSPSGSFLGCICCCCCCWIRLIRSISSARSIQYAAILAIVVRSSGEVSSLARANKSRALRRHSSASMARPHSIDHPATYKTMMGRKGFSSLWAPNGPRLARGAQLPRRASSRTLRRRSLQLSPAEDLSFEQE